MSLIAANYLQLLQENLAPSVIILKSVIILFYLIFFQMSEGKERPFGMGTKIKL